MKLLLLLLLFSLSSEAQTVINGSGGSGGTSYSGCTSDGSSGITCTGIVTANSFVTTNNTTFSIDGLAGTDPCSSVVASHECMFFNSANSDHLSRKNNAGTVKDLEAGSGGATITQGAYSALPATCTTNDVYFITSGLLNAARCSATNTWSHFYDGHLITPAASLSLTTLGTAVAPSTLSSTKGYELLTQNASGSANFSARYWTPCAQPCITKVVLRPPAISAANANYRKFIVGYMDSAGLMSGITCTYPDGSLGYTYCQDVHVDATGSQTTCCASTNTYLSLNTLHGRDVVIILQDDGTNIKFGFSNTDDDIFEVYKSEARGSYLASPSRAFYGVSNTAAGNMTVVLVGTLN